MSNPKSTAAAFVKSMQRKNQWDRRRFLSTMAMGGGMLAATRSALGAQLPQQSYFPAGVKAGDWAMIGHDLHNTRFNPYENTIAPNNVSRLKVKWTFDLAGDFIQSTPVVVGDRVYFASYDGYFYGAETQTGEMKVKMNA